MEDLLSFYEGSSGMEDYFLKFIIVFDVIYGECYFKIDGEFYFKWMKFNLEVIEELLFLLILELM